MFTRFTPTSHHNLTLSSERAPARCITSTSSDESRGVMRKVTASDTE